jgi:hypothetical protein
MWAVTVRHGPGWDNPVRPRAVLKCDVGRILRAGGWHVRRAVRPGCGGAGHIADGPPGCHAGRGNVDIDVNIFDFDMVVT